MYRIRNGVNLITLEKYGFEIGKDIPDNERCICNDRDRADYWLIPRIPFQSEKIYYADEDNNQPIWSIHVQTTGVLYIDCVPSCSYHISNIDMELMFFVLKRMIEDGIIDDDYEPEIISKVVDAND